MSDTGSLFVFRRCYITQEFTHSDTDATYDPPFDVPDEALAAAIEATDAETRAVALLARAEQYRAGLEAKLLARGLSRDACRAALDRLVLVGLLSDKRYAGSWIRQRVRRSVEGPRSLSAALSRKGVERHAIAEALGEELDGERRQETLLSMLRALANKGFGLSDARDRLVALGWRGSEIDEAYESR